LYRRLRYFLSNFAVNPALNSANASSAITNHHAQRAIGIEGPKAQRAAAKDAHSGGQVDVKQRCKSASQRHRTTY
jgi:hypothetical protein